ncbi:recombinase family protein [Paraburkholderia diazotrophica]|uniref:Putative DNA-invertase from lambdoid prophage Rac n=1 Tax=Paraburkholderia diazotrophica TaxID=667676 RepID=A0A1H6WT24_9BURK|nr:recombinase family protein [Paraburkholderia diazotrophica]SEJ18384.1 putative DNA-invertase from lambdoid prophage Rac [Paraburkholderia diazotrophica]
MRQTYFYINGASDSHTPEHELIQIDKAGYTVALNRVAIDDVPQYFPAADRPQLNVLLRRIARDDLLVVLKLSALGCSARDVLATLTRCRSAKVSVRCVELGSMDLTAHPEPQAVKTLRAIVQMEIATRSQRSRKSLQFAQESGRHTGRPASLSRTDRARVMRSLDKGLSVSEVARKFGTSRQTIMRIRDASSAPAAA